MSESSDFQALRWKLLTTFLSFSLIPLIAVGFFLYSHLSSSYKENVQEGMRTLVENRKNAIELFFEERISQLFTMAQTVEYGQITDEDYLLRLFNVMQMRSKSYIDIGVIDQQGNHVAYVGPYPVLKEVNYKEEPWFLSAISRGVYVSDVFRGFRYFPHVIIAVTVREHDKTWILRATINLDIIEDIIRSAQVGRDGDAFVVNRDNILQTNARFSGTILEPPRAPDFSRTTTTRLVEMRFQDRKCLFAATFIPVTQWVLVIAENPEEQLSPLLRARDMGGLLFLLAVGVITFGTIVTTRAIMNKLEQTSREKAISDDMVFQSNKMAALGKMAAGIAHEINNPLAVIGEKAGWVRDLLRKEDLEKKPGLKECDDAVTKIEYHVDRARRVTHRLLGFARRMEPVREAVDLNKLLRDTMSFMENEAHYRDIGLVTKFDPQLPTITSDAAQLQQVFLNIINNAVDAIDRDGEVTITTQFDTHGRHVQILISDTGPGISEENLDQIFDPFFTTKDPGKGTGLGLSISYQIIEILGGKISVTSEIGKGSTFIISLPVS